MPAPDQYTATRLRTTLPTQVMRGSQIGWYWVNSLLPLTTWLPPTKAIRDQLKVWPLMVDDCAGIPLYGASILGSALHYPPWWPQRRQSGCPAPPDRASAGCRGAPGHWRRTTPRASVRAS